jgi:hypothetical protein
MGQVPMAAARDGLFPPLFGRLSPHGVPAIGITVSAMFATGLVPFRGHPWWKWSLSFSLFLRFTAAAPKRFFMGRSCSFLGYRSSYGSGDSNRYPMPFPQSDLRVRNQYYYKI